MLPLQLKIAGSPVRAQPPPCYKSLEFRKGPVLDLTVSLSLAESEYPGGGRQDPGDTGQLSQAGPSDGGLRGGEGRGPLEADLR